MPPKGIEKFLLRISVQTAVYWGTPVPNGFGGYTFAAAKEIAVRWENKQERMVDALGEDFVTTAFIIVNEDVDLGGYLYLGDLDDLDSDTSDPQSITGAWLIRKFDKTPMIKKTDEFVRQAYI